MKGFKIVKNIDNEINILQENLDKINIGEAQMTFLQVLNKATDEILITKYLAFLLDERNTTFNILKKILTKTYKITKKVAIDFTEGQLEEIHTEYQITNEDRLDVFIKYSNFWVVIENKIGAGESKEKQTVRYKEAVERLNEKKLPIYYLYLKPKSNLSKQSESDFKVFTYDELFEILDTITEADLCKTVNYKFLLDFKIHIKERLMEGLKIDTEEMSFWLKNQTKLSEILEIYRKNCNEVKEMMIKAFEGKYKDEFVINSANTYIQVYRQNWDDGMVHFELQFKKNGDFKNIISQNYQTFCFCTHQEGKSRNKYKDITNPNIIEKFKFDNYENIIKSIENIIEKFDNILVKKQTELIDSIFNKN